VRVRMITAKRMMLAYSALNVALLVAFGALVGVERIKEAGVHEGYERGALQTASYVICAKQFEDRWPKFPSMAWRKEAWHSVDWDNSSNLAYECWLVEAIRRKVGETPQWDVTRR
jgi:hypothetical protein